MIDKEAKEKIDAAKRTASLLDDRGLDIIDKWNGGIVDALTSNDRQALSETLKEIYEDLIHAESGVMWLNKTTGEEFKKAIQEYRQGSRT